MAWSGCATAPPAVVEQAPLKPEAVISYWSPASVAAAAAMLEELGAPDFVDPSRLVWRDKHLFRRIAVWAQSPGTQWGVDVIEAAVDYRVPPEKRSALAAFSDKLDVSPGGQQLTAWSGTEETAVLTLNLADEIVKGLKTPEEARASYDRALRLKASGKTSELMGGLLFLPASVLPPLTVTAQRPDQQKVRALKRTRAAGGVVATTGSALIINAVIIGLSSFIVVWGAGLFFAGGLTAYLSDRRLQGYEDFGPAGDVGAALPSRRSFLATEASTLSLATSAPWTTTVTSSSRPNSAASSPLKVTVTGSSRN
jgi:hypothetical protein